MSIDFNYLKYKLKEYLISDFTFDEISKVLNDVEVEKYSREYVKSLGFNEEHEKALRLKYRQIIDECYQKGIPLGLHCLSQLLLFVCQLFQFLLANVQFKF